MRRRPVEPIAARDAPGVGHRSHTAEHHRAWCCVVFRPFPRPRCLEGDLTSGVVGQAALEITSPEARRSRGAQGLPAPGSVLWLVPMAPGQSAKMPPAPRSRPQRRQPSATSGPDPPVHHPWQASGGWPTRPALVVDMILGDLHANLELRMPQASSQVSWAMGPAKTHGK